MIKNKTKILIISTLIAIMPSSVFASVGNFNLSGNQQVWDKHNNGHFITSISNNNEACVNENSSKEDCSYASIVNEYTFLSQDEKDILINTNKQVEELYNKISKIYDNQGNITYENLSEDSKTKITSYENEINNLEKNIKDINKKVRINNNKELTDGYTFLTQDEKNTLLETYNSLDDIYEEKNQIFNGHIFDELNSQEKDKIKECNSKIIVLQRKIKDIKKKIDIYGNEKMVKEYTFLTQQERDRLLNAYNEMNEMYLDMDELYILNSQGNNENNNKLKELENKVDKIRSSIKDLNKKIRVHYDKEAVESYKQLTSDEKNTILKIYNDIYELEDKIDNISSGKDKLSNEEQKEIENLSSEINNFYEKVYAIEEKNASN